MPWTRRQQGFILSFCHVNLGNPSAVRTAAYKIIVSVEIIYLQSYSLRNKKPRRICTWSQEEGLRMALCCISLQSSGRHRTLTSPSPVPGQIKWERNEMSSYCSSSLACQTCSWKKLLVPLYMIRARFFSWPMMLSLLWWYFPRLAVGVPRGEGWDSTGDPDSTHAWSSRLGGKVWGDQIYSS